jgi:hypothetical protein
VTQGIKTVDDMREELKKLPSRMRVRTTLTAICLEASSNTVAEFATRPHKRKGVNMSSLFEVFAVAGHELVVVRPDIAETAFRSGEELKEFLRLLSAKTGKSLTAMTLEAKISLGIVSWVSGSSRHNTIQLEPLLKLLNSQNVTLRLRKIQPTKAAAKRAILSGS